jgi:hypothetical protein
MVPSFDAIYLADNIGLYKNLQSAGKREMQVWNYKLLKSE